MHSSQDANDIVADRGADSSGNLNGSLNTMDCYPDWAACLEFHQQQMQPGLVSRDGWSVIDDSRSFLFDGDPSFPPNGWRVRRDHEEEYTDWVFFGHGRNYTEALSDFTAISGSVPSSVMYQPSFVLTLPL